MSDGPHRSLKMRRGWKRVAEFADNAAASKADVRNELVSAFADDWRQDVQPALVSGIREILGGAQGSLFRKEGLAQLEGLRPLAAGHGLGQLLVDCAVRRMASHGQDAEAPAAAVENALKIWGARHGMQIEEHYCRESSDHRAANVRSRIQEVVGGEMLGQVARDLLQPSASPSSLAARKKAGIDDGVQLP